MTLAEVNLVDTPTELTELRDVDPGTLDRLQARLSAEAEDARLLDLAYTTTDSPVGPLLLAATERGLVRIAFAVQDHDRVLAELAEQISPRILRAPRRLDQAVRELEEYFDGRRHDFDLPVDLGAAKTFRRTVQRLLPSIAYGQTVSYTELATRAGNAKAVRAVGSACATNPLPVVVPCHRVLRSDGSLGGYAGGLDAKRTLLTLESRVTT
ncbi:MAG: methylated-DNA--[protein]-cysteine S-methyltransferase [Microlunatus sp.]|nr:methylated-DNA--[protein]-cysteine S-methyltransferase [Microlunatus sp.]MDN5769336.1 methylated-DNA--[protein]-cysteine S-methyltransferase [Microlunatus sp.]